MLLNAYAFWKLGQIALYSAIIAFVGGAVMLVLTVLGIRHRAGCAGRADPDRAPDPSDHRA